MAREASYRVEVDGEPVAVITVRLLTPGIINFAAGFSGWPNDRKRPKLKNGALQRWRLKRDDVEPN